MKRLIAVILAAILTLTAFAAYAQGGGYIICTGTSLEGASGAQVSNIRRAIAKIHGTVIPTGGVFSFNDIVGPRTKAYGFQEAQNGRGVTVTGGGVAQAASTLYLALMGSGANVQFYDLRFYGSKFTGGYTDPGSAVLVDYSGGIDFAFANLGGDLNIDMWIENGALYCGLAVSSQQETVFEWNARSAARTPVSSASIRLGGDSAVNNNIRLAAASINDSVLTTGMVFSFNDTVGPRTGENGYVAAVNGRGVTVTGGGVAQVASAIWLAIKNCDGIAVAEKSTYGSKYNQSYVASSSDAILVDYSSSRDFSFRNTGDAPLTICTYIAAGELVCEIYRD